MICVTRISSWIALRIISTGLRTLTKLLRLFLHRTNNLSTSKHSLIHIVAQQGDYRRYFLVTSTDSQWETRYQHHTLRPKLRLTLTQRPTHAHSDADGHFRRKESQFRNFISTEPGSKFPPEKDRYALYVNYGCPWVLRPLVYFHPRQAQSLTVLAGPPNYSRPRSQIARALHPADHDRLQLDRKWLALHRPQRLRSRRPFVWLHLPETTLPESRPTVRWPLHSPRLMG